MTENTVKPRIHVYNRNLLVGNGFDIQFGGREFTNKAIVERAIANSATAVLEDRGYLPLCADFIARLWRFAEKIVNGEADSLKEIPHIKKKLDRFKRQYIRSRRNEIGKIGIEDYLFIYEVVCMLHSISNPERYECRELLKNCFLDAIFCDGKIQNIHKNYPESLQCFMSQFDNIFTTNYGNSLEIYLEREILYLHGAFHILDDRYSPNSFLYVLHRDDKDTIVPKYEHLKSTAILSDDGQSKEFQIGAYKNTNSAIRKFAKAWEENSTVHDNIETWNDGLPLLLKKSIHYVREHPDSNLQENIALERFKSISGDLCIIGLSPFNDNHIFDAINDCSAVSHIIFYFYEDEECGRIKNTLDKKVIEFKPVKKLWSELISSSIN